MKAYELHKTGGPEAWVQVDRPEPRPGPGQALVRIHAVSLNYRDFLIANGRYMEPSTRPILPVSDGAGEVVAVGAGVTRVKPGDRVAPTFIVNWMQGEAQRDQLRALGAGDIDGVLAEYVTVDAEAIAHLPEHYTFEEGATLPCAAVTVWNALVTAGKLQAGQTVLTQGTGGVSIFALQFAHMLGARVIITSSQDEKLERARALGADGLINYKKTPDWEAKVLELTGGKGVDHVIEVGGEQTLQKSIRVTAPGGHIHIIGLLSGAFGTPDPALTGSKQVHFHRIYVGSRAMFEDMNQAITRHKLKPVIDRTFPFEQAREALRYLQDGAHFGKVVIKV